jgi:hypothetical protein
MKTTLMLVLASGCLLSALPAQASLVVNGDFETAPTFLSGWTASGGASISPNAQAHTGLYAADLKSAGGISQTVGIVAGQTYILDFWAKEWVAPGPAAGQLNVTLDGLTTINVTTLSTMYQEFTYTLTPTAAGLLSFQAATGSTSKRVELDDVSLTAVPEPTTMIAGALLLLPFGASTLRMLRKNRSA